MKKSAYISILSIILLLGSCEVLDVQPYHSIPAELAITNAEQVESAVMGCYDALQSSGYYGLNFVIFGDLSADNLTHVGITVTWAEFDNNNILADNGLVEGTWASIYTVLNRVNNVIDKIPSIDNNNMSDTEKNLALGELRFLRALAHYDLLRLFGPIPIRDKTVNNDEVSLNPPRNTKEEVLLAIHDDLQFAVDNLSPVIVRGRASKPAAQALKARVALHQYYITLNTSYLNEAIDHSTAVINNPALDLEPDYARLYSLEPTIESIFEVAYNDQDRNLTARYFAHTSLAGRYEFAPTSFYLNSFDDADKRKDISVAMAGSAPYVIKSNDISSGTDPVYVFRLAEMYMIRAEAAALLQLETNGILHDINKIRERAGLEPANITSYAGLLLEIESQRQKEFAFEGHRWFDLVRTGRAMIVLDNVTNINQTLYPIPQAEIIANDNPGMYQNDGY
jgi:starch-binding outer membrane protein, SusD/RagB family